MFISKLFPVPIESLETRFSSARISHSMFVINECNFFNVSFRSKNKFYLLLIESLIYFNLSSFNIDRFKIFDFEYRIISFSLILSSAERIIEIYFVAT